MVLVSGGICQVPSDLKYLFVVPEATEGISVPLIVILALLATLYVVLLSGGTCHVPSALRYLLVAPSDLGANPAAVVEN